MEPRYEDWIKDIGERGYEYEDTLVSQSCGYNIRQLGKVVNKLIQHAKMLNAIAPMPWSIKSDGMDGYIYDADGKAIFGGESGEGYIGEDDEIAMMLVKLINDFVEEV